MIFVVNNDTIQGSKPLTSDRMNMGLARKNSDDWFIERHHIRE